MNDAAKAGVSLQYAVRIYVSPLHSGGPWNMESSHETISAIERVGGRVYRDDNGAFVGFSTPYSGCRDEDLAGIPGSPDVQSIYLGDSLITDVGLAMLGRFGSLEELNVSYTGVTGVGFCSVQLPKLRLLKMRECRVVNDEGVKCISQFQHLQQLALVGTAITDKACEYLAHLTELEGLWLDENDITDAGFLKLSNCQRLKFATVASTRVSTSALERLAKAVPAFRITFYM